MQSMIEQQWCACGKTCRGASNFQQMLELADAGIIVYYHGSQLDETHNRDRTVFIIRNNKDVEMSSDDIQKALGYKMYLRSQHVSTDPNKISCPRCFHIYKRAQKLFKDIPSLAKKQTIGICDHCSKFQQRHSTGHSVANRAQCKCKNVITRFLTSEKELDLGLAMDAMTKHWQSESKLMERSISESRKYHSDENVWKDLPREKENLIEKQFRFVFPKDKQVEPSHQVSSSELIRDLQGKDGRKKSSKQVEHKKPKTEKEEDSNKSSRGSTAKREKEIKDVEKPRVQKDKETKDTDKTKSQKEKETNDVEKQKLGKEKDAKDVDEKRKQQKEKENKDFEKLKPQKEKDAKDVDEKRKQQKEKENKDLEKLKPQKEKDAKDVDKKRKQQKEKENKDLEKLKPQKEKDAKDVDEKRKQQKEKENKDLQKLKPQKEKGSKDVEKSKQEKETKADAKTEKESTKKDNDADNLLIQLLAKSDKAKAESDKNKKEQELASLKAKFLADQKLKELTLMPALVKVKSPRAEIKNASLNLEVESNIAFQDKKPDNPAHIIIGKKIFKYATSLLTANEPDEKPPLFFKSAFQEEAVSEQPKTGDPTKPAAKKPQKEIMAAEIRPGVIRYALSNRTFIEKGWTKLPTEKVVRKMNVYRMRPAHPEFDWFEHNKKRREILYDSGQKLAEFSDDGRGRWFYRNGKLALDYYNAEESNAQQRYVVYSNGEPDERGRSRPRTVLATFDYSGNGVVFDHNGKIRLKYNQTEGVLLDRSIGPVSHWKWHDLNDPPVLQQVMVDTQVSHKDPRIYSFHSGAGDSNRIRPDKNDEDMLAIEFNNFIKEKSKKLTQTFQPYQIKMKALKINENFSLKILDQASVYLIFRDGLRNMKINIGMVLDHKEIVDTDTADVGDVSNSMQRFPARTDSLAVLQQAVAQAQRTEHLRVRHEQRLHKPTGSLASADRLTAAASRPLRPPLMTNSNTSVSGPACKCTIRKPTLNNVYYDNRISS